MPITREEVARYLDHALLRADVTHDELLKHCELSARLRCFSVCVAPVHVRDAVTQLSGTGVRVGTVVGFPLGFHDPEVKAFEARRAIRDGAEELDVVIQVGHLKSRRAGEVREDLAHVRRAAEGRVVKAILETSLLSDEEIEAGCRAALDARVDFVKTSTGHGGGGATLEAVRLMRRCVGDRLGVKASGGISTTRDALAFIENGATRLGTSRAEQVLADLPTGGSA